jgi:hypothetical protein
MYQHLPFKGPPKFTPRGIFALKTNYLVTLLDGDISLAKNRPKKNKQKW